MPKKAEKTDTELVGAHVRIFRRGARWYANFQNEGKQRRLALKTTNKKEARRKAVQIDAELCRGEYEIATRAPTIEEVIQAYRKHLVAEGRAERTLKKYDHAFWLVRNLADRRKAKSVLALNLTFVDAFRAQRKQDGSQPKTIHNDTVLIRQMVNFALARGLINKDPLKGLKLKKPKPTPQPCWNSDEVEVILLAASEVHRPALTMLADTGMRVGELKHLTWADIDLDNGIIHVRPKEGWKPKTGDIRVIPMSPRVKSMLTKLPQETKWVFCAQPSSQYPAVGRQVSERRLLQHLKRVLKRLSLPGHLHTFRHSFISKALTSGVPEAIVREWVGHVDHEIIRHYTHIADVVSKNAMLMLAGNTEDDNANTAKKAGDRSAQFQHNHEESANDVGAK